MPAGSMPVRHSRQNSPGACLPACVRVLLDPALDSGPTRLSKDGFLLAWEGFDSLAAVISR